MSETRAKNSRSPIWRFFEPVDVKNTKCLICESIYRNSGNTTNLIDHLKRRHQDEHIKFLELMKNQADPQDTEIPLAIENIKYEVTDETNQEDGLEMDIQNENVELIQTGDEMSMEEHSIDATQLEGQIISEGNEDGEKEFDEQNEHEIQIVKIVPLPHARSEVWTYFGFVADNDGQILDKTKVVCKLCASTFCYSGNTTNFYSHLKSMHSEIQMRAVPMKNTRTLKRSYASMNNTNDESNENDYLNDTNNTTGASLNASQDSLLEDDSIPSRSRQDLVYVEDITQALVDFIVTDCRPVGLTQGKGFQKLLRLLAPGYSLPDKQKLEIAVRKRYDEMKKEKEQGTIDYRGQNTQNY